MAFRKIEPYFLSTPFAHQENQEVPHRGQDKLPVHPSGVSMRPLVLVRNYSAFVFWLMMLGGVILQPS